VKKVKRATAPTTLINLEQTRARLGVSRNTLLKISVLDATFPVFRRIGNQWKVEAEEIELWIKRQPQLVRRD
jgi:predicted DNA-binding transcriptional regulator AlpA